jgi:MinD superfamily P-loop ATPase
MNIKIAVASGKGGTGKTTIATSLAISLSSQMRVTYVDCDVEAPDGHIFLDPQILNSLSASIRIPEIDRDLCRHCGKCVEVCQFHALAKIGNQIMTFSQLCHGCGSCTLNCPHDAIKEVAHQIGRLEYGKVSTDLFFYQGILTISEPMATPVVRQLKQQIQPFGESSVIIYDSPPGASCPVVETIRGSDFIILVTEPTPFGLHDLKQILGIAQQMKIPFGVVINRNGIGDTSLEDYLHLKGIPILMRIPFQREFAAGISAGNSLVSIYPSIKTEMIDMFQIIQKTMGIK